jgi:NAD(P)-dependent dehydrogenase (short-subunit alcohol dehydrogenase family)
MTTAEHVLVTGANRGIGIGIVHEYLKRGGVHL